MTRPLGEPSAAKILAAQRKGIESLSRRPAPVISASLEVAYMNRTTDLTIVSATPTTITSYNTGAATGGLSVDTTNGVIDFTTTGIYHIAAMGAFSTSWATGTTLIQIFSVDQTQAGIFQHENQGIGYGSGTFWLMVSGIAIVTATGSPDNQWGCNVTQNSGSNKTLTDFAMAVTKLGGLP